MDSRQRALRRLAHWQARANRWVDAGHYHGAERCFARATRLAENLLDARDPALARLYNDHAILGKHRGDFEQAEARYLRALWIAQQQARPDPEALASIHHNLGGLAHARGDYAAGESWARRGIEWRQSCCAPDDPALLADRAAWVALLDGLGRYQQSEPVHRELLAAFEALHADGEVAATLNNLGVLCLNSARPEEAEQHLRRAVELKESTLGSTHPELAHSLVNLATACRRLGRTVQARELYTRALGILESQLLPEHPRLVKLRRQLERLAPTVPKLTPCAAAAGP